MDSRSEHETATLLTSLQNPRVKEVVKLRQRRDRDDKGLFLIEGYRELRRAADNGAKVTVLFYCPELFLGSNEEELIATVVKGGVQLCQCAEHVFRKLSYRDRPDGLLAIAVQQHKSLADLQELLAGKASPFLIVAEAIEKPGNLGTILRSADAAGADAVIICDRCTDIFNPNVVRASVGTLFTVPIIEATSEQALRWMQEQGITVAAATPAAAIEFTDADFTGAIAIAVGTEQLGLSALWMEQAEIQVRIPMNGVADSLNVATATTLLVYEVVRQRKNRG